MSKAATGNAQRPAGLWRRVLPLWLVFSAIYLIYRWPYVSALRQADPDDTLRLVQVRDLLSGQGWFDLHQYRANPPDGVVMHWSRLVDMPIALVELLLRPLLGIDFAEKAATVIVPLAIFGIIMFVLARTSERWLGPRQTGYLCVLLGASFPIAAQVLPTRVDHHGWQIAAVAVALLGFANTDSRWAGRIVGAAMALGMAISIELLPIAALFGGVFALGWLFEAHKSARLRSFTSALAAVSIAAFALTRGPDWTNYCDAVSPAYLAALLTIAFGTEATARWAGTTRMRRLIGLGLTASAAAAVLLSIAPACAAGPFSALDPLLNRVWLANVREGMPVWQMEAPSLVQWTIPPFAGLLAAWHLHRSASGSQRVVWLELVLLTGGSLALGSIVLRSMSFAVVFALIPLAWLVHRLVEKVQSASGGARKLGLVVALPCLVMPALPVQMGQQALAKVGRFPAPVSAPSERQGLRNAQRAVPTLASLPRGTVLTPFDQSPWVLLNTRHAVVATGHHRGAAAMHDVMVAFIVDAPVARSILARHGVRYLVMDPQSSEVKTYLAYGPDGFAAKLAKGETPDWLTTLKMPEGSGVLAWEVR